MADEELLQVLLQDYFIIYTKLWIDYEHGQSNLDYFTLKTFWRLDSEK